ncbi:hypothetical protein OB955_06190 [Halobacteria archaeon AArc-m2/3/4]|uniref:Uncharacterized protein n=1 Tax=Natronoglomus mannanivorans TaxID=2979990 RepID=A0AAP3E195_9EURY|nr:hypothetical protein [Halobacteria archaeon AArc-xg1-1]MCU4972324.1 hypothetical protein [Halobacteria archaeon AArc-m2/3/4]
MRQVDSTQNRRKQLSRRQYAQILAGAGIAGLAGCFGDDGEGNGDDDGNGGNGGNGDDDGNGGSGQTDPQRETLRVHVDNVPEQAQLNPWAATPRTEGELYFTEISAPSFLLEGETLMSGHTWDASWTDEYDEISIPTMYTGFDIEPPYDVYDYYHEDLTYWDGTPIDPQAKLYEDQIYFFNDGHQFNDEATFNNEVVDDTTYHWWQDKGEVEGQTPSPRTEEVLRQDAAPTQNVPPHPDFTQPYVEEYEDADTQDEADRVTEELASESINYYDLAENEWGSGLYQLDPDQMSEDTMIATKRDDHPNEHAVVEEVQFQMASADRRPLLAQQGEVDLSWGVVQESDGDINREQLPDHMQELDRYLQDGGDHLLFNWDANPHLENLWVRRAFIAAINWNAVGNNGWGPERSTPNDHHICMLDNIAEAAFDDEFLDSLYQYPIESDYDLAVEWLENAGYSGSRDSGWESPEGEELTLSLDMNSGQTDWIGATETMDANLSSLGVSTEIVSLDWDSWQQRYNHDNVVYESGIFWTPGATPWEYYEANGQWWTAPLVGGDPESEWSGDVDYEDYSEADNHGRPFEQEIPNDVGSIDAPNEAGRQPSLSDSELISLPELTEALRNPELGLDYQESLEKLARYANFYVPYFTFHTYTWGTWGNVRDFSFPERGHPAHQTWKEFSSEEYHTLSGIVQHKYDDEYPEP